MSMFGNYAKDYLYDEMVEFIEDNPLSELIDIVRAVIEYHVDEKLKNEGDNK